MDPGVPPLFGRHHELEELCELLQRPSQLVTVVGIAGVGKSRLVDEAAERLRRDGLAVHPIPLDPNEPPEEVLLRALSCEPGGSPERVGRVLAALGPALLVLDGAEDAVEPLCAVLPGWLAAAPDLRVVTTSRMALGLAVETRLALEPLGPDDGLALFAERGRRLRRDLRLDSPEARALVRDLDGLPGAIEWAAAQLATLSVPDLAEILDAGKAGDPPWARGIDASIRRLSEPLRAGLLRLAAFGHPLPPPDAAEVVGGLGALQELRRASLVGPAGGRDPRLRVYRTVCHALAGDAWSAERADAARAHAASVLARARALAQQQYGPDGPEKLTALAEIEPELRLVVTRALGPGAPLSAGLAVEAIDLLGVLRVYGRGGIVPQAWTLALLRDPGATAHERAVLLFQRASLRFQQGQVQAALADLAEAEGQAEEGSRTVLDGLLLRAAAQRREGATADAAETARQALAIARSSGNTRAEVEALAMLARTAPNHTEHDQLARAAVQLARASGDLLGLLGPLLTLCDSTDGFREGLAIAEQVGFARVAYYFHSGLAVHLLEDGSPSESRWHHEAAVSLARRNGWEMLVRESEGIYAIACWSFDAGVDCRPAVRLALTDSRGGANQETLLSFLYAAEAEADPSSPPRPFADGRTVGRLCAAAAALHHARTGEPEQAVAAITEARKRLEPAAGPSTMNERIAQRVLKRALARLEAERDGARLWVGPGGAWFCFGDGPKVSLARRIPLQRLLQALAVAGASLTVEALFAAGWPGQSIRPASASHRVYVAINDLRRLGLGDRLQTADGGYRLEVEAMDGATRSAHAGAP